MTPGAITQAISSGRIRDAVVQYNGKEFIDHDLAMALWEQNTVRDMLPAHSQPRPRPQPAATETRIEPAPPDPESATAPAAASPRPKRRRAERAPKPADCDELRAIINAIPDDEIPDINDSRRRRAYYQAEKDKQDALQRRGELVPITEVRREASRLGRQIRDLLLMIPSRNSAMLCTMQEQESIRQLLQTEIESALRGLADA